MFTGSINIPLLRHQQHLLAAIKAGRVLLKYQPMLRRVLKRPALSPHTSLEALNEVDDLETETTSLLLHQLIATAVQPSPLKSKYSCRELEARHYCTNNTNFIFCLIDNSILLNNNIFYLSKFSK